MARCRRRRCQPVGGLSHLFAAAAVFM